MRNEPKLKPAGSGLPFLERQALRLLCVPISLQCTSWNRSRQRFIDEAAACLEIYRQLPPEKCSQKVLIKRLGGFEDSSRYWSPSMVLEHMVLVAKAMTNIIVTLDREQYLVFDARITQFKPKENHEACLAGFFDTSMRECAERLQHVNNRNSRATHAHPWFGKLNAHGWHTVLALHQKIHRQQLELIRDALKG